MLDIICEIHACLSFNFEMGQYSAMTFHHPRLTFNGFDVVLHLFSHPLASTPAQPPPAVKLLKRDPSLAYSFDKGRAYLAVARSVLVSAPARSDLQVFLVP